MLLVVHGIPSAAAGGTELHVAELARGLAAAGDAVAVVAREDDPERPEGALRRAATPEGSPLFLINRTYRGPRAFATTWRSLPAVRRAFAGVVAEVRPDVAHVHHLAHLGLDLAAELRAAGVPLVLTLHDHWLACLRGQLVDAALRVCPGPAPARCAACVDPAAAGRAGAVAGRAAGAVEPRLPPAARRAVRAVARRGLAALPGREAAAEADVAARLAATRGLVADAERVVAPSEAIRAWFVGWGAPAERVAVVRHGVDPAPFAGLGPRGSEAGPPLRLGFVGSLAPSKGVDVLLEAFRGLPAGRATLDLYGPLAPYHGDSAWVARVRALLAAPGVRHRGAVDRREVPGVLAGLDALVVPSVWPENSPLVVHEAFLAGTPVVATRAGGLPELVAPGAGGLLVAPGDAAALRRALARLIDEPGLLEALRAGIPPPPTLTEHVARLRALYADVAAAGPRRPRLAAVVVNYGTPERTARAVRDLRASARSVDEVVVVDQGGAAAEALRVALPDAEVVATARNLGFAGGANAGLGVALERGAERVLLLNSDAALAPDALGHLETALAEPGVGVVGPAVLEADGRRVESLGLGLAPRTGRLRERGRGLPAAALAGRAPRDVDAVSGCALLLRREVAAATGGFDERYFLYVEDVDLCRRARRAGFRTRVVPAARVRHDGSRSFGGSRAPLRLYYAARNHLLLGSDLEGPGGPLRQAAIAGLNLVHALRWRGDRARAARAVLRGVRDHVAGRYGEAGPG